MKYHLEKAIHVITRIENEHLDYNAQMRRLADVAARFAPLMHRLDANLPSIQEELGLPLINTQLGDGSANEGGGGLFDQSKSAGGTLFLKETAEEKQSGHGSGYHSQHRDGMEEKQLPRVEFLEDGDLHEQEEKHTDAPRRRSMDQKLSEKASDDRGGGEVGEARERTVEGGEAKESHVCKIS
jgi:hypothetical protein